MFWHESALPEEEWSLSAKVFAGLVLNPLCVANRCDDSLFGWFFRHVTGETGPMPKRWSAKPEYRPVRQACAGRNDWRIMAGGWTIAIECKFGNGLGLAKDCCQYLNGLPSSKRRLVLVASASEFSELTQIAARSEDDHATTLREAVAAGELILLPWDEVIEEASRRLPDEMAALLTDWAKRAAHRDGLALVPPNRISGKRFAEQILNRQVADIPITHARDARARRKSTATVDDVCRKTNAPEWVKDFLALVEREAESAGLECHAMQRGWVNVRRPGRNTLVLVPWRDGISVVIAHPRTGSAFPGMRTLGQLEVYRAHPGVAAAPRQHFDPHRSVGMEFTNDLALQAAGSVRMIFDLARRL